MKQNTTYKQTELGLIPEDWEVKKLGEVIKLGNGKDYKHLNSGNIPVYGTGGIITYVDKYLFNGKSVGIGRKGSIDKPVLLDGKFWTVDTLFYVKEFFNSDIDFIYNSFLKIPWLKYNEATGLPSLSQNIINNLKIPLPPLPEQKKIADCLSTWDVAIEKQSALINALTDRKKALMQQLLTGKKRLPGFSGEWKEVKLGSLGKTYNGLTGKTKEDFGEGKPFITYMNIFSNPKINISNFEYVKMGVNENQNKAIYGDIFFTVSSETPNEVGMASVLLDEINDLYLNSFCFGFRLNDFKNLLPEFSSYLFRNDLFRKDVYKLAQGSTRFNLSKLELMKIKIKLPSFEEQTAIAEILATADRELQLQKEKLAHLQLQKKGLMQVLLTGKKRLLN